MKEILMAANEFYIFLNVLFGLTLLMQVTVFVYMKKLLKAARNVKETENHSLIKQMKLGYTNAYKLSYGVNNTEAFIEKYLIRNKVLGMPIQLLASSDEKMSVLAGMGTVAAILLSVYREQSVFQLVFITGIGIMYVLGIRFIGMLFATGSMKKNFMTYMTDYFENVLQNRLKNHKHDSGKIIPVAGNRPKEPKENKTKANVNSQTAAAQSPEELIVEEIIKEFFP